MKIIVTGGAGFIGSHVVDLYIRHGYKVVIIDDLSTGRVSNIHPEAAFYQMDIRSPELEEVFAREKPDFVNHHAAQMDVRRSVSDPMFDCDVNIKGSLNLIECARRSDVKRFIYISSGGAAYGEPVYLPCDEMHPIDPICQYGASKHTVEHYLFLYHKNYGMRYVVLRYPNVYGPRQDPAGEAGVVAIFMGLMLAEEPVTINGDGKQERDFVYVADCAQANVLAVEKTNAHGIYNLGSGKGTNINEIFDELAVLTGYQQEANYGPAKLGETRRIYLDATKAQRELDWHPTWSLKAGLTNTMKYFQQNEQGLLSTSRDYDVKSPGSKGMIHPHSAVPIPALRGNGGQSHRASVEEGGRQAREVLERLYEIVQPDNLWHQPALTISEMLGIVVQATRAKSGSMLLLDQNQGIAESAVSYNGDTQPVNPGQFSDTLENGLAGWVARNRQAVLIDDTWKDSRWLRRTWEETEGCSRSAMSAPVHRNGQVAGVLTLLQDGANAFKPDDLALLVTLSAIITLAVRQKTT